MSMLSRWTIGAIASKKASASLPVAAPMLSASAGAVSGPVATIVEAVSGSASIRSRTIVMLGCAVERRGDAGGEAVAVDRQRRSGGHRWVSPCAQDQRAERAHLLVEQADGVALGIVGAEAVRADQFGQAVGVVRRRHVAASRAFRTGAP